MNFTRRKVIGAAGAAAVTAALPGRAFAQGSGPVKIGMIMPLVKQRDLLLMGNFSFQVNHKVQHDKWFNNSPWNDASSWSDGFFKAGQKAGAKSVAILAADQEFAQNLANGARELAKKSG